MPSGKKTAKKMKNTKKQNYGIKYIVILVTAIIFGLAAYTDSAGTLSMLIQKNLYKIIGILVYILPVYAMYYCIEKIIFIKDTKSNSRIIGTAIVLISLYLFCGTLYANFNSKMNLKEIIDFIYNFDNISLHAGIVGAYIIYPLRKVVGLIGTYIFCMTFAFIGIIVALDITIYEIINRFTQVSQNKEKIDKSKEKNMIKCQ